MDILLKQFLITGILLAVTSRPLTSQSETAAVQRCKSTQIVEYDREAVIHCHLQEDFYGVYWYDSIDVGEAPIISLEVSQITGPGYTSGEFSIEEDGSLIINRVTSHHNHTFSVAFLEKNDADPVVYNINVIVKGINEGCNTTQYLQYGRPGIVNCFFIEYFGVFWYSSIDTSQTPIILYKQSEKNGDGYKSKEFDIQPNGSLVITNVTLSHDHVFAVALMKTQDADALVFNVSVVVTAHPSVSHPVIKECPDTHPCFLTASERIELSCFVKGIRPAVDLRWLSVNRNGMFPISFEKDVVPGDLVYSIYANISQRVETWTLLRCEGSDNASLLKRNESLVLIEPPKAGSFENVTFKHIYTAKDSNITLECSKGSINNVFTLWRKITNVHKESQVVLNALGLQTLYNDRYIPSGYGQLTLDVVKVVDEGVYSCTSGDGLYAQEVQYHMTVIVYPKTPSPTISECGDQLDCILSVDREVELLCYVLGVRPAVVLEWDFDDEDMTVVSEKSNFEKADGTIDSFIKSRFQKKKGSTGDVEVAMCKATTKSNQPFLPMQISTNVTLHFSVDFRNTDMATDHYTQEVKTHGESSIGWFIIIVIICFIIMTCLLIFLVKARKGASDDSSSHSSVMSGTTESESLMGNENAGREEFEDFRKKIGLEKWIEDGLLCQAKVTIRSKDRIIQFFQKLDTGKTDVIKLVKELAQTDVSEIRATVSDSLDQVKAASNGAITELSCRDIMFAIIHSCDRNLRRTMLFQISLTNVAIPLLLPLPDKSKRVVCLIKDFENISKKLKDEFLFVQTHPFPVMAAVRIGKLGSCSKSSILNTMFGKVQGYSNRTFFYGHQDDNYYSQFTNGTVEVAWFTPNGNTSKEENILNEEMCILNYRGSLNSDSATCQEQFVRKFSSIIVIFVREQMLESAGQKINSFAMEKDKDILVVKTEGEGGGGKIDLPCLKEDNVRLIDVRGRYSETAIAEEICQAIKSKMSKTRKRKTLSTDGKQVCEELGLNMNYDGTLPSEA